MWQLWHKGIVRDTRTRFGVILRVTYGPQDVRAHYGKVSQQQGF